jgi:hypothetical protein
MSSKGSSVEDLAIKMKFCDQILDRMKMMLMIMTAPASFHADDDDSGQTPAKLDS